MHLTKYAFRSASLLYAYSVFGLLFIFLVISPPSFAVAPVHDLPLNPLPIGERSQHDLQTEIETSVNQHVQDIGSGYVAEFIGIDRGIIGRATVSSTSLANNAPANLDIIPGGADYYEFPISTSKTPRSTEDEAKNSIDSSVNNGEDSKTHNTTNPENGSLSSRQSGSNNPTLVYLSMNVCQQPSFESQTDSDVPPQLSLYVSTSDENTQPGPTSSGSQKAFDLEEGFLSIALNASSTVYVSVHAPDAKIQPNILWNYELAASTDAPYHSFNSTQPFLYLVDSDQGGALLVTPPLSESGFPEKSYNTWIQDGPPFSIFVKQANDTSLNGMKHSYCGLRLKSQIQASNFAGGPNNIRMGITTRGVTHATKQEIYIPFLNGSSTYDGFLAVDGNSTASGGGIVGGGGTVFQGMNFTTKTDGNCAVIFNLTFCNQVAYAVPSNPYRYDIEGLSALYDSDAASLYQNFSFSLQQIPCNTSSDAQYSLARNCDDCASAYKTWLCAVTIPRCADFSSPPAYDSFLKPRNVAQAPFGGSNVPVVTNKALLDNMAANSTRNNYTIAGLIQPGPYKEVLPCETLCYNLVQSCPAALGFVCPLRGLGLEAGYGQSNAAPNGAVSCSAPGAVYYANVASRSRPRVGMIGVWALTVTSFVVFSVS